MRESVQTVLMVFLLLSYGCAKEWEWKEKEKTVELDCDCDISKSSIIQEIECRQEVRLGTGEILFPPSAHTIKSWKEYTEFRGKSLGSTAVSPEITEEFFQEYNLGVVCVSYTGETSVRNVKLLKANGRCRLSYEIRMRREEPGRPVPSLLRQVLFLLRLKR